MENPHAGAQHYGQATPTIRQNRHDTNSIHDPAKINLPAEVHIMQHDCAHLVILLSEGAHARLEWGSDPDGQAREREDLGTCWPSNNPIWEKNTGMITT